MASNRVPLPYPCPPPPAQPELVSKPGLANYDGQPCPDEFIKGKRFAFLRGHPTIGASRYAFKRPGRSGAEISELLPHLSRGADEITVVKSLYTDEFNHAPAQLFLHTGFGRLGRPSLGSWVTYGLGSENADLPAYVVLLSGPLAGAGTSLWGSGFLPSVHQGVLAGGVKAGITHGRTDDLGYRITENPVHVHDLNATGLHLLGLNHERLTFRYQGRDFRLTDVHGRS